MAYATGNPKTKKALKEAVAAGEEVEAFSVSPFGCKRNGVVAIEGPHYPQPHRWYAEVLVENGFIVKVLG